MRTVEREQIPSMMATLCSYEHCFGPYHPQTLGLMTEVAAACWQHGDAAFARRLLERVIADLGRDAGARIRAIAMLKDLFLEQGDLSNAASAQRELWEYQVIRHGADHPESVAARAELTAILFSGAQPD